MMHIHDLTAAGTFDGIPHNALLVITIDEPMADALLYATPMNLFYGIGSVLKNSLTLTEADLKILSKHLHSNPHHYILYHPRHWQHGIKHAAIRRNCS